VKKLFTCLRNLLRDEGSAAVEFSMLAIPLFIPVLLYLNSFASLSFTEVTARSLVRQMVRAYALSDNAVSAETNTYKVLAIGGHALGYSEDQIRNARVEISCDAEPCWRPGVRVRIELRIPISSHTPANSAIHYGNTFITKVAAEEFVSRWR
jgi:hypothetical protein